MATMNCSFTVSTFAATMYCRMLANVQFLELSLKIIGCTSSERVRSEWPSRAACVTVSTWTAYKWQRQLEMVTVTILCCTIGLAVT
jgi:hypothetical protein